MTNDDEGADDEGAEVADATDLLRLSREPGFIMAPILDRTGRIVDLEYVFLNDAALALYGMRSEDVIGHGLLEIFPSARDNGIYEADLRAIRTQKPVRVEVPWVEENGVMGAFALQARPHGKGVIVTASDVTAELLARRDRQYRLLAEGSGNVVLTHGLGGETEWVSPSVTEVLGWSREAFLHIAHRDLVHPHDVPALAAAQAELQSTGQSTGPTEARFATAWGSWRWMSVVARPLRDVQGDLTGAVESLRDVHAEVVARQALAEQAERLELVLASSGLGMWDHHVGTGQGIVDQRWAGILGYALEELAPVTAATWKNLTHPDDVERVRRATRASASGMAERLDIEFRMRHRRGHWVWIREKGKVVAWSAEGRPSRVTGTIEDVTEIVMARQARERDAQTLRTTQTMARLGSWQWDLATDRAIWSDELFVLFGLEVAESAPDFADQELLYNPESWERLQSAVTATLTTGEAYELELEIVKDGSHSGWVHVRGEAVRDAQGAVTGELGYVLDVTARRDAERALAQSESLFRTAMLTSPIGLAILELDGSFRVVNASLCALLGRDEAWLLGSRESDVMHPEDVEREHRLTRSYATASNGDATSHIQFVREDGQVLRVKRVAEQVEGTGSGPGFLLVQYVDTTAEHEALERLAHEAFHDALTGLRNRAWILEMMELDLRASKRSGSRVGVLFVDLDRFKIVNDSLGHAAGDEVLTTVASRIFNVLRPTDRVGRSGGDEFVVVVPDVWSAREVETVAERIVEAVSEELTIQGHRIVPTVSIGIALNDADDTSASLLRNADAALFRAKAAGRSRWQLFDQTMHAQAMERLTVEEDIRRGLQAREFVVHYQPIVSLTDLRVDGHEALVRWQHPTRGLLYPASFLATAEDSGLIVGIGQQVLDQVCELLATDGTLPGTMSVNFSPAQLACAGWLDAFTATLSSHGVDPTRLILEITETAVLSLLPGTPEELAALRAQGVGLHVDDFGTGFSSISLLRDLPVTGIKLDASFVADLSRGDTAAHALSTGLAGLVNGLHLNGIAEGVESLEEQDALLRHGWSHAQGYYFARPSPRPVPSLPRSRRA